MAASPPYDPVDKHDERHQRQNENQPDHHNNFLANDPVIGLAGPPALPEPPGSPDWGTHGRLISHKRGIRKTLARPARAVGYANEQDCATSEWFAAAMKSPEVDAKPKRRALSGGPLRQ